MRAPLTQAQRLRLARLALADLEGMHAGVEAGLHCPEELAPIARKSIAVIEETKHTLPDWLSRYRSAGWVS